MTAMAEYVIGLFESEVIRQGETWRSLDDVEFATLEWVAWFNTCRLMEPRSTRSQRSMTIGLISSLPGVVPQAPCGSLRSLRSAFDRTYTSESVVMLGTRLRTAVIMR